MMNLKYSFQDPPQKKLSPRQTLDELVRLGYRPYICGDPGYGIVIIWAQSLYREVDLSGEPGFKRETHRGWHIPTRGLVPAWEATLQRVADTSGCESPRRSAIEPSLEHLITSSVKLTVDELGIQRLKPLI